MKKLIYGILLLGTIAITAGYFASDRIADTNIPKNRPDVSAQYYEAPPTGAASAQSWEKPIPEIPIQNSSMENTENKRFQEQKAAADRWLPQAFSEPQKILDRARKGESGISAAAFLAVANRAPSLWSTPSHSADDWIPTRIQSFDWLDKAARNGDFYAMWLYGGQAEVLFSQAPDLSDADRQAIASKARGHLFSLISNGVLEAFPTTAGYYLDGTLGKRDLVMALAVAELYVDMGGAPENIAMIRSDILRAATTSDIAESKKLLAILRQHPLAPAIGARI